MPLLFFFQNLSKTLTSRNPLDKIISQASKDFHQSLKKEKRKFERGAPVGHDKALKNAVENAHDAAMSHGNATSHAVSIAQALFSEEFTGDHFTYGSSAQENLKQRIESSIGMFSNSLIAPTYALKALYGRLYASGICQRKSKEILKEYLKAIDNQTADGNKIDAALVESAMDKAFGTDLKSKEKFLTSPQSFMYFIAFETDTFKRSLEAPREHIEWLRLAREKMYRGPEIYTKIGVAVGALQGTPSKSVSPPKRIVHTPKY